MKLFILLAVSLIICASLGNCAPKTKKSKIPKPSLNEVDKFDLTREEAKAVKELRERVKTILYLPYMEDERYLVKWIRAKDHDLKRAEEMLRTSIAWRKEKNIDELVRTKNSTDFWKAIAPICPYRNDGVDVNGIPVFEGLWGSWDIRRAVIAGRSRKFLDYINVLIEETFIRAKELGGKFGKPNNYHAIMIANMAGFNRRVHLCSACIATNIRIVIELEANHPDLFSHVYCINTPQLFHRLLQILKPFFSATLLSRFQLFDSNRQEWEQVIGKHIPKDQRLVVSGGTKPWN